MAQSKNSKVEETVLNSEMMEGTGASKNSVQDYFPDLSGDAFQTLSKSDYAKVIFCHLYNNTDTSTVGCKFQITDNVHEDPCDYIGLYKVGYDSLSQCLASKMLSSTEYEDDGKLLSCTFKSNELPELEHGFYQFLYVTRDQEVCGASMPFEIKNVIPKDISSDEDVVADKTEDDFLVVRSNAAEKLRRLQLLLDEMTIKCSTHESEMKNIQNRARVLNEEKLKLEQILKKACEEKLSLIDENRKLTEERDCISHEKEEAVRILKEKNTVLNTIFDDFSCKLNGFTELKDALEADKNLAVAENVGLQERIKKLTEDLQKKQKMFNEERERNQEMIITLRKENTVLGSQLEDARLMIEALEKSKQLSMTDLSCLSQTVADLKQKFKDAKCDNYALKAKLQDSTTALKQRVEQLSDMKSEVAALKLHIIEMEESKPLKAKSIASASVKTSSPIPAIVSIPTTPPVTVEDKCAVSFQEESSQASAETNEELQKLKMQFDELNLDVEEKKIAILKLQEELARSNAVVDYLSKERDSVQKNGSRTQDALSECMLRLNEASELYKKQYRKIEKLKKKLKNSKTSLSEDITSEESPIKIYRSSPVTTDRQVWHCEPFFPNQNSDSDTGEHVPDIIVKSQVEYVYATASNTPLASSQQQPISSDVPSTSKPREVPELQTLIDKNLEKLSNSKSKDEDEILYAIPCPVCDQDVGVYMSSTDEMVKHLEIQHQQQLCPVCGRLFDMTLPPKYFQFHVEDHFKKGDK